MQSTQHAIYKMRVFVLASKFWGFSQVLYRGMRTRLCKSRTLHIAKRYVQAIIKATVIVKKME